MNLQVFWGSQHRRKTVRLHFDNHRTAIYKKKNLLSKKKRLLLINETFAFQKEKLAYQKRRTPKAPKRRTHFWYIFLRESVIKVPKRRTLFWPKRSTILGARHFVQKAHAFWDHFTAGASYKSTQKAHAILTKRRTHFRKLGFENFSFGLEKVPKRSTPFQQKRARILVKNVYTLCIRMLGHALAYWK
jgi:hypothetical protein